MAVERTDSKVTVESTKRAPRTENAAKAAATSRSGATRRARAASGAQTKRSSAAAASATAKTTAASKPAAARPRRQSRNGPIVKNTYAVQGHTVGAPASSSGRSGSLTTQSTASAGDGHTRLTDITEPLISTLHELMGKRAIGPTKIAGALADGSPSALKTLSGLIDRLAARHTDDDLDPALWGAEPTAAEVQHAQLQAELSRNAALERTMQDALSREQVAEHLGISPQAVSQQTKSHQLVALKRGRQWQYPRWQFADDGVVPGVADLIDEFPSRLALTVWMTTPSADLDDITPTEMLHRRNGAARVAELAQAASPAAW